MDEDPKKVADMREQIKQGEYRVEPTAVADAILRRLGELAAARGEHVAPDEQALARRRDLQMACSNPAREPLAPPKYDAGRTVDDAADDREADGDRTARKRRFDDAQPDPGTQTQSS